MSEWKEFSIHINKEAEDSVSEILMELGSSGVSIIDREDFETLPQYGFDTLWELDENKFPDEGVIIKGYFDELEEDSSIEKKLREKIEELKELDLQVVDYTIESLMIADTDWNEKWKEFYHSVPITRYLTIVPEWEDYPKVNKDEKLIVMDPGLAFGTGTHPTTQLSIQALETEMRGGEVVLDVGTGSGVLTIASALLGAKEIHAYDLDDMAIVATKNNIALNNLSSEIFVNQNNLLEGVTVEADIVVANILAPIIIKLIADALSVLKPGGIFITSGIIAKQKKEVATAMTDAGFRIKQINQMEDWISITVEKPLENEVK